MKRACPRDFEMTDLMAIVLAAGDGTRMRSAVPKVLHCVGGLPIVSHVVRAAQHAGASSIGVVTAPNHDIVRQVVLAATPQAQFFEQAERRGTAHAASMARALFDQATGYVAIVYADHPLLRAENFTAITQKLDSGLDAVILGFQPADPTGYGRFITQGERLLAIREHRDASEEERKIGLCNACILAFKAEVFRELIDKVKTDNAQGEYYLTDLVGLANEAGYAVGYAVAPEVDVMGVNDRAQLARAEGLFQARMRSAMMANGVTLLDPATVYFSHDTQIARDVTIEPSVVFGPGVRVGEGAIIHAFSHIEGATIGPRATIGPFARLRPEAELGEGAKVGNFVEIKKATVGAGAKVNHLTYIGDAEIGAKANIGAGTVTCNYDGVNKARTVIGANSFIGSNSSLVAPVRVGEGAYVGSGSVITQDVPDEALALGRARQVVKPGRATLLRERALAKKAAAKGEKH